MKNILKKIMRAIRRINYVDIGEFKDGKALALMFVMWNYSDPSKNMTVVIVDEDYKIVEWTDYRTIKEAEKALCTNK